MPWLSDLAVDRREDLGDFVVQAHPGVGVDFATHAERARRSLIALVSSCAHRSAGLSRCARGRQRLR